MIQVDDSDVAVLEIINKGPMDEKTYLISTGGGLHNTSVIRLGLKLTAQPSTNPSRPGHDRRHTIDTVRSRGQLGRSRSAGLLSRLADITEGYRAIAHRWYPRRSATAGKHAGVVQ